VAYMAPEVTQKKYDPRCDLWSCGVLMYFITGGELPFRGRDNAEICKKVQSGIYSFGSGWVDSSQQALDVVTSLIQVNPQTRLTAQGVLTGEWLRKALPKPEQPTLPLSLFSNVCNFKEQSRFIRASFCLIASLLSPEQLSLPDLAFRVLDKDGDGIVTPADLKGELNLRLAEPQISQRDKVATKKTLNEVEAKVGDRQYTYTEFLAASFDRSKYLQDAVCKAAFSAFDQDNDGTLTLEELASGSLLGGMKISELTRLVNECDINGDGVIDFDEYCSMMRKAV